MKQTMKQTLQTQPCKLCPTLIISRPNALYCDKCREIVRKQVEQRSHERQEEKRKAQKTANMVAPEVRQFQQASDADVLHWMGYTLKQMSDIGEHGPVIHYDRNHPEFAKISAMYQ